MTLANRAQRLAGQVAVVTGGARGIGLAIAKELAEEGAQLVLADVQVELLEAAAAELRAAGAEVATVAGDLSKRQGAVDLLEAAIAAFGKVGILVNNAGGGIIRPFLEHDEESLRTTLDRNIWTTLWCCHVFLPHFIERGGGRIVNISADSVHTGINSHAGYNAAKGGVNGLTTGLAFEFGKYGITINAVSPGGVMTEDLRNLFASNPETETAIKLNEHPSSILKRVPIGRFAEMDEVASLVAFLASSRAASINGQIYSVNGGQWMM